MTIATPVQPDRTTDSGSQYPANIDAAIASMGQVAWQFAPFQVPPAASAPSLSSVAGGSLGATTYYVRLTYVTDVGEVEPSAESSLAVAANSVLVVTSPPHQGRCTGYNVYVSTSAGTETKQNGGTPIDIGTDWTEPTSGLVSGAALPSGLNKMQVALNPGLVYSNPSLTSVAAQISGVITAPVSNPRIDRIVIDASTGAVSVVAGTEAASPSAPAIPTGKYPVCQVLLQTSTTAITNSMITDERIAGVKSDTNLTNDAANLFLSISYGAI